MLHKNYFVFHTNLKVHKLEALPIMNEVMELSMLLFRVNISSHKVQQVWSMINDELLLQQRPKPKTEMISVK